LEVVGDDKILWLDVARRVQERDVRDAAKKALSLPNSAPNE
jgi:hypothetical protein